MSDDTFNYAFQKLSSLFDGADDLIQEYNLLLIYLQKNPPEHFEQNSSWREVKDLKSLLIS